MNKETIIQEILSRVTATFDRLDLPKQPYGRNELWEGITDYFKIKQRKDKIQHGYVDRDGLRAAFEKHGAS